MSIFNGLESRIEKLESRKAGRLELSQMSDEEIESRFDLTGFSDEQLEAIARGEK